jgi:hypothetical protein
MTCGFWKQVSFTFKEAIVDSDSLWQLSDFVVFIFGSEWIRLTVWICLHDFINWCVNYIRKAVRPFTV